MFSEKPSTEYPFQKKTEDEHVTWTAVCQHLPPTMGDRMTHWPHEHQKISICPKTIHFYFKNWYFQKMVPEDDGIAYAATEGVFMDYLLCDAWLLSKLVVPLISFISILSFLVQKRMNQYY